MTSAEVEKTHGVVLRRKSGEPWEAYLDGVLVAEGWTLARLERQLHRLGDTLDARRTMVARETASCVLSGQFRALVDGQCASCGWPNERHETKETNR